MNFSLANMNVTADDLDYNATNVDEYQIMSNYTRSIIFVPLNGIVIWLLGFQIKKNPFTVLILNLAIADFGCLVFWLYFAFIILYTLCQQEFLLIIRYLTFIMYINAISIDRVWLSSSQSGIAVPAKTLVHCCLCFSG
ncbi:hypothetical protein E2320_011744 [Naja naja]|nr:hypothetical protein E2320_011744 [Naja naja]